MDSKQIKEVRNQNGRIIIIMFDGSQYQRIGKLDWIDQDGETVEPSLCLFLDRESLGARFIRRVAQGRAQ